MNANPSTADYVVVGTGSAGAAIAARLSEDQASTVVALEAGPRDKGKFVHIPAGFSKLFRSEMDWDYETEPQPQLADRKIYVPRGKTLGGSSSMNAMMWVRGFAADYDEWAAHVGPGWSFGNVVRYLRRIESVEGASGPDEGTDGPMTISRQRSPRPFTASYLQAVEECGYKVEHANQAQPEGFTQTMVSQKRGARWSTADGYLNPASKRPNLTVATGAQATRVIFDGARATGVEYLEKGTRRTVHARREVILSGGAINSPQLLMLSGIGDRDELSRHGISVHHHLPAVGKNLLDHLMSLLVYEAASGTLFAAEKLPQLVNYLVRRRGMLTSNVAEAYGFVRSRPDLELPDLELIFGPAPYIREGLAPGDRHGVALGPILQKPESAGEVRLRSADPLAKPIIDPRYLSDPDGADRAAMLAGLRICQQIASAPALKDQLGGYIQPPMPASAPLEEVLAKDLEEYAHTLYHPVGTCRMGSDSSSVVDPELRVRGVEDLRVADASVIPTTIRGHTHAPSVVIGEKAADLIRKR
jgi:choline dehydrogenase